MILDIYEVLMILVLSGVLGSICALLSYFLDYCFWPQSIFSWYLPALALWVLKRRDPKAHTLVMVSKRMGGESWQESATSSAEHLGLYKILGGCSVCFNIWLAMISFTLICSFTFIPWYGCFPYVLISSAVIRKLVGATY